ncbi:uncharacterized protein LOC127379561 isoform X6 [Dicentrarchus labrax]|uniref:uncharacterized protein LOC127379561 isoform X5 n=1 Tax=Dicentrarchus labrax TaxID=13489 RepID=UPI0021F5DD2E|nr:uncharacterized protein LOC127379561 isoform X5 [Dicentrarchus labrax]XP_051285281.1 uncharacterized protein LOC127379561 isoform X6 [Dicentrarchus labrax]
MKTDIINAFLVQGECRFVCGQPRCDVEWPFEEVCKMALLSPEEKKHFEQKMFSNAHDLKLCPGCKSSVVRTDPSDLSIECSVCTANKQRSYRFCWQCLKEWKGPAPRSDRCENDGCINQQLETLRNSPVIVFKKVKEVTGCPSIRACPTCGLLLEHNRKYCKTIICRRCKVKFCFVCLKLTGVCRNPYGLCSTGVAPRQTSIPVWQRK